MRVTIHNPIPVTPPPITYNLEGLTYAELTYLRQSLASTLSVGFNSSQPTLETAKRSAPTTYAMWEAINATIREL